MNFIFFSGTAWDGPLWGARQQIASKLVDRGHGVLYVEGPRSWEDGWFPQGGVRSGTLPLTLRLVREKLWVFTPPRILPGRWLSMNWNVRIQEQVVRSVKGVVQGIQWTHPVLFVCHPYFASHVGGYGERFSIYHATDNFTAGVSGVRRRTISGLEERLCDAAGGILAVSEAVHEKLSPCWGDKILRFPAAADRELFSGKSGEEPEALKRIPRPIVGQVGVFNERTDVDLLEGVIRDNPTWSFVFLGPVEWEEGRHRLQRHSNVSFLGRVPFGEVPSYVRAMDVCLLAYRKSPLAEATDPLKLHEYIAAGRPVVATSIREVIRYRERWGDIVRLADTPGEMSFRIASFLNDPPSGLADLQREAARANDWEARVDTLLEWVENRPR
jgi:glycosyltransferase involved in cell wall biosynthesis